VWRGGDSDGARREEHKGRGQRQPKEGVGGHVPLEPAAAPFAQQRLETLLDLVAVEAQRVGRHQVRRERDREGQVRQWQPVRSGNQQGQHDQHASICPRRESEDVTLQAKLVLHLVRGKVQPVPTDQLGHSDVGPWCNWAAMAAAGGPVGRNVQVQRVRRRKEQQAAQHGAG
jgi:hypothetical protein